MNSTININSQNTGRIISIVDGIANVSGMGGAMSGEVVIINEGSIKVRGLVLTLHHNHICVVVLGKSSNLTTNATVFRTGTIVAFPIGFNLLGCVVDSLGERIDGGEEQYYTKFRYLEMPAPGIQPRSPVNEPLLTGILGIDTLIPIGKGQRELIIGDRQTGKTSVAVDAIVNQRNVINEKQVYCVYVAIGQKRSSVIHLAKRLKKEGAMYFTTIVAATASEAAAMKYLAPYAGCTFGEFFRDMGFDALVVYDDLTKHADAYREMSLILRRSPARDAYPSDIFYSHSRLLERAAKLNKAYGYGSLTALPIVETQAGDVSAFIPTNVISITDGQIYLESILITRGILPAINFGLSVSRVGTRAQYKAVREVSRSTKLDLAQYRELETVSRVSSDLDETSIATIRRGERLVELLKQPRFRPMAIETQVLLIYGAQSGFFDELSLEEVKGVKEYLIRLGEYSPFSDFFSVHSGISEISDTLETLLEGAFYEYSEIAGIAAE